MTQPFYPIRWANSRPPKCQPRRREHCIQDGTESDIDCGGSCRLCVVGKICRDNSDCASSNCDPSTKKCSSPICSNGVKDPGETDIDCGGSVCAACANDKACTTAQDCMSGICHVTRKVCVTQCADSQLNGDESDVDCGGSCATKCAAAKRCLVPTDCASGICSNSACVPASGPPTWVTVLDLPNAINRVRASLAVDLDGKFHILGGCTTLMLDNCSSNVATTHETFNPADGSYALAQPDMPNPRPTQFGSATAPDGRILVFSGTVVEAYDPVSRMWATVSTTIPRNAYSYPVVRAADGRLYLFGGAQAAQPYSSNLVDVYDAMANTWNTPARPTVMPLYRAGMAACLGPDNRIYVAGGSRLGQPALNELTAYNPSTDGWAQTLAPMPTGRAGLALVTGADGRLYAIGGGPVGSTPAPSSTVEAYAIATNKWATMPSLTVPGMYVVAATGADGRIYAFSGAASATTYRKVVEAYGPFVLPSTKSAPKATVVNVTGSNFAASANVKVLFDSSVVGTGRTDSNGAIVGSIAFGVPDVATGPHRVTVVDDRSEYPAYFSFTITP